MLAKQLRGLAQAREKGRLLAWDNHDWLYLLDQAGKLQGQIRTPEPLAAAACADDGSAYLAGGSRGDVWWLAPDLSISWHQVLPHAVTAIALDSFGHYAAVADAGGNLSVFDHQGRIVFQNQSPRPFQHLTFVPAAPLLVGCSDFGLVACADMTGQWLWRDGLVAHVGALTVAGSGEPIVLTCFSEGLQRYGLSGTKQPRETVAEPCRLASISFDGQLLLVAGLSRRLRLLNSAGRELANIELDQPVTAIALSALGDGAVVACADGTISGFDLGVNESTSPKREQGK